MPLRTTTHRKNARVGLDAGGIARFLNRKPRRSQAAHVDRDFRPRRVYAFAILPFASTDETPMPVEAFHARNRSRRACSPEWLRTHVWIFDVTADDGSGSCATSRPHAKQLCRKRRPNFKAETFLAPVDSRNAAYAGGIVHTAPRPQAEPLTDVRGS